MAEEILRTEYSEEMQKSYLDYSMSVITSRAIPDARDGLKPVQRRVLYDMSELHTGHAQPHKKSARIVGDAMGKYHPHGDSSIYETLVGMSQAWKKSMPLVDGHGNFGSIEGDGAAAMRYTEARLQQFAEDVYLRDLDKTVRFVPNYDETETEPEVLPVRVPNLLVNGSEGIAVGMSTSTPTHNLAEVCDCCIAYIKNRDISTEELLDVLHGPDFPTGGIISNKSDLLSIYETGTGRLRLRGKTVFEEGRRKTDKDKLVITEIPYTMIGFGINKFLEDVAGLCEDRKLPDVTDISNQSDKDGIRIVLEIRKGADIEKIRNILYKKTKLEDTFSVNILAIAKGRPETLNLRGVLENYLDFQYENATRKYNVLLEKALERQEVQEGLMAAVDVIDVIIAVLRGSKNLADAKNCLINGDVTGISFRTMEMREDARLLRFTERQAQAILDMRLYRLIGLEMDALRKEHAQTIKEIRQYQNILRSRTNMDEVFIADLENIKKEYGCERKTLIEDGAEAVYEEAPAAPEEVVFVMDRFGYCKTLDKTTADKNQDAVAEYKYSVPCWNNDKIYVFTTAGNMHSIKVTDAPSGRLRDKGIPIDNISRYDGSKEEILKVSSASEVEGEMLLFVTADGLIKKVPGSEFITSNRSVSSTKLAEGDRLIDVETIHIPDGDVVLFTDNDYALRFPLEEVTEMKKTSKGEKAMKLSDKEKIASAYLVSEVKTVTVRGRELAVGRMKAGHRNQRGTKVRA